MKYEQDFYVEDYKTLLREIRDYIINGEQRHTPSSWMMIQKS